MAQPVAPLAPLSLTLWRCHLTPGHEWRLHHRERHWSELIPISAWCGQLRALLMEDGGGSTTAPNTPIGIPGCQFTFLASVDVGGTPGRSAEAALHRLPRFDRAHSQESVASPCGQGRAVVYYPCQRHDQNAVAPSSSTHRGRGIACARHWHTTEPTCTDTRAAVWQL